MSDANEMKADDAAIAGPSQEVQSGHSARNGAPDGTTHERFPGQLQMVNLEKLKAHLGEDWQHNKGRVHNAVTSVLQRELGPWDFSSLIGQEHVLIIYGADNVPAAEQMAGKIGAQIETALGGGCHSTLMDIRPANGKLQKRILLERDAPELDTSTKRYTRKATWEAMPTQARIKPEQQATAPAAITDQPVEPREAGYAPMWNIRQEVLTGYAVMPVVRPKDAPPITGYDVLGKPTTLADIQLLDIEMLHTQISVAGELLKNKFTSLLVSQLHSDTLSFTNSRKEILRIAQKIPPQLKNILMIQIVGIPENTPATTIAQRIAGLQNYFRAIIMRIPSVDFPLDRCKAVGATAVSYILPAHHSEAQILSDARRIITDANAQKLLTCFEYVPTVKLAAELKQAGAVFVTGNCLGDLTDAPGNMRHLKVKDVENREHLSR